MSMVHNASIKEAASAARGRRDGGRAFCPRGDAARLLFLSGNVQAGWRSFHGGCKISRADRAGL